ncbi:hypothetical protein PM082_017357 [Marasmius tenuissimus]|nr:hypothetical protein PM082_017357 [Marasmius tenuissimus]
MKLSNPRQAAEGFCLPLLTNRACKRRILHERDAVTRSSRILNSNIAVVTYMLPVAASCTGWEKEGEPGMKDSEVGPIWLHQIF